MIIVGVGGYEDGKSRVVSDTLCSGNDVSYFYEIKIISLMIGISDSE